MPVPGAGDVLIEVSFCGVCGSDLHIMIEGWGKPGTVGGHEYTGVVASVGDGVTQWQVGDEVVCGPSPRCGECRRCREGKPSQCERRGEPMSTDTGGGFARFVARRRPLAVAPARRDVAAGGRPRRAVGRRHARHHPLGDRSRGLGHGVRGRSDRRPHHRRAHRHGREPRHRRRAGPAAPPVGGVVGRDRGARPVGARDLSGVGAPRNSRPGPSTPCSSARARSRPWSAASTSSVGAATSCSWARAWRPPPSTRTA